MACSSFYTALMLTSMFLVRGSVEASNDTDNEKFRETMMDLLQHDHGIRGSVSSIWGSASNALRDNANAFFLISMAIQVHIMQCGFALLETGCIRAKSATNSMWKNVVCGFVAAIGWYLTGFGFTYGESVGGFVGTSYFAFTQMGNSTFFVNNANLWFFQYSFCTTAATIISGAIAERAHLLVFLVSSFVTSSFTYPFVAHWAWNSEGWLKVGSIVNATANETIGYDDFAGSGVVHLTGGAASLASLIFLRPRIRRFPRDKGPKFEPIAHSTTLAALGCMILSTEFVAFNAGSELRVDHHGNSIQIGLAAVNTMIAGAGGFLSVAVLSFVKTRKFLMLPPLCGSLAGNVAICAGCYIVEPWAALLTGAIAGLVYVLVSSTLIRFKLDDPIDAVGVHFGGAVTGLLTFAFLKPGVGVFYEWDEKAFLFLGWQLAGTVTIFAWAFSHTIVICLILRALHLLHVSEEDEEVGLDYSHGHEPAYPKAAYFEIGISSKSQIYLPGMDANETQPMLSGPNGQRYASTAAMPQTESGLQLSQMAPP